MTITKQRMAPRLTFHGAAQGVSGSLHHLEFQGKHYFLDCGLTLGRSPEAEERNQHFPVSPSKVAAVFLTHAHIDHCGNLPNLVRQGFKGPIYCTAATKDLLRIMLADSARIQEKDAARNWSGGVDENSAGSLYSRREVETTLAQCVSLEYEQERDVGPGLKLRLVDAGHLLGSAMVLLSLDHHGRIHRLLYTGDLGRPSLPFLRPPAKIPGADLVISESTYGGRVHQDLDELQEKLRQVVETTVDRHGKVLVPAFSLGRAQLVVHFLATWMHENRIPDVPIFVDSPLAADIQEVHLDHPHLLRPEVAALQARSETKGWVRYVRDSEESRELSLRRGPAVVVASGGMCEAGRILGHFDHNLEDPRNTVVLVSYQAPGSLGRKLMDRGASVSFRGRVWRKWADVVDLNGFSGHADQLDLLQFFKPLSGRPPRIRLVHGELSQSTLLQSALKQAGFHDVEIPARDDSLTLTDA